MDYRRKAWLLPNRNGSNRGFFVISVRTALSYCLHGRDTPQTQQLTRITTAGASHGHSRHGVDRRWFTALLLASPPVACRPSRVSSPC